MGKSVTLLEIVDFTKLSEFDNHQSITCFMDNKTGLKGFVSIHRSNKHHPAFGATRIWNYATELDALKDSLRLARTMSYKCALAGLKYGGAKGVLIMPKSINNRHEFFKVYAKRINTFSGSFITGADVGLSREDVINMKKHSKYFVGTQTDPVRFTALGIFYAIQVSLSETFGDESCEGRSFAIQGVGKVGSTALEYIYNQASEIYIADINIGVVNDVKKKYPKVKVVSPKVIHSQEVDVFVPCALSSCVNKRNIDELKCKIIAGGANNQLDDEKTGEKLFKRGILYAPDFVVNSGGLISVADEYEHGNYRIKRVEKRVENIKDVLKKGIEECKKKNISPLAQLLIKAKSITDEYM
ncbi:leucine dehydrogenase [Candidatus Woesebacteria bacterium]|nr:MAG: leucine dehydrogenase [Candidatus Woesebacteria bacterium]